MSKALVAYFSATGKTKAMAEKLASGIGADLFEIVPEIPYEEADLKWMNKESRSSVEMMDKTSRPAISSQIDDISQYDVIFVGFPVWWYREPSIIDTFMEAYDFSGKTIVPFATSGGTSIGDTYKNLQALAPDAKVAKGERFRKGTLERELARWASEWVKKED